MTVAEKWVEQEMFMLSKTRLRKTNTFSYVGTRFKSVCICARTSVLKNQVAHNR